MGESVVCLINLNYNCRVFGVISDHFEAIRTGAACPVQVTPPQSTTANVAVEECQEACPQFEDVYSLGEFLGAGSMSVVRRRLKRGAVSQSLRCVRKTDGQTFAVKCVTAVDDELRQFTREEPLS